MHPDDQIKFWEQLRKSEKAKAGEHTALGTAPIIPALSQTAEQDQANEAAHAKNAEQSTRKLTASLGA